MEFTLDGKPYLAIRYKLRAWLRLDAVRETLVDAIEAKDIDGVATSLCSIVSIASSVSDVSKLPWYEIANAFIATEFENKLTLDFALLRTHKKHQDIPAWDYQGRQWYWWHNILSSKYGWSSEYVAEMDIDDATGLLQEIMVDEQFKREWEWSLTEIAYPYNEATKKSNFKPLERPEWMRIISSENIPKIPMVRIRKDMMPVGFVVRGKSNETPIN